jgi:alpha-mannosidase
LGEKVGAFGAPEVKVIESGPVRATLRVITRYKDSILQRDYSILSGDRKVTVKVKIDFHEKHKTLKFAFPLSDETVISKTAYGTVKRRGYTGEEPCGSWIASGDVCVANDSKYGYDTEDGDMRMTMLRSAIYADHFGKRDEFCEFMEQGISEFTYSVFPYESDAVSEKVASELNFTLPHIMGSFHKGNLPDTMSCFECENDNIIVTAVKQAEGGSETIIRAYEANGNNTAAKIKLFNKEIVTEFSHNQVKTFKENDEVNMIEW